MSLLSNICKYYRLMVTITTSYYIYHVGGQYVSTNTLNKADKDFVTAFIVVCIITIIIMKLLLYY